ncbi:HupE/UreJ family protein [Sediminicola sp. 1XM1-17]|uniref:HupE/UreJ family protein n=1 Tax=Sediminicola sp. 1XM1-17 TaxID=3127702 RepID=UPI003076CD50
MENFWFYLQMGLDHVLDLNAYDHILFLAALVLPFTFKDWKKVLLLATVFTIAHCISLAFSVYGLVTMNVSLIEFLIPVTILFTALYNLWLVIKNLTNQSNAAHLWATAFFGLVHGFGFSNYFKMLMAEEEQKSIPLLGFATGIELSQVFVILGILLLSYISQSLIKVKTQLFIGVASILIIGIVIPMLVETFPW